MIKKVIKIPQKDRDKYDMTPEECQKRYPPRKVKMVASPPVSPERAMLNNFVSIFAGEIARLMDRSTREELDNKDTKKLQMLVDAFTKMSKEIRETRKDSILTGKSDEEIKELVLEALTVVGDDENEE
jgi:hypothetical protein